MLGYREALELFRYDYETGILYWRWRVNNLVPKTLEAGTQRKSNSDGYLNVSVHGRLYPVHRVVMLMCYGFYGEGLEVDHINHVRNDNRLFNLRFVTGSENSKNQSVSSKNTSGVTGVYFSKAKKKYIAQIKVNREVIYLGMFETLEGAAEARRQEGKQIGNISLITTTEKGGQNMLERKQLYDYQNRAVAHIIDNECCALFLGCGMGKTVSTLTAIKDLLDNCIISNCLVIAPKKVTQVTWSDEIKAWEHLKDLTISVIDGTAKQRREAYQKQADIYAISRDNIVWLVMEYGGIKLPYDMVVIDELSSFKNHASKRFKALRKVRKFIPRVVGLTGTPSPNGLIDLFAQMYLIDQGQRLGKSITAYRDRFFRPDKRNGDVVYSYALKSPQEETEQQISDLISDITISMTAEDFLKMPDRINIYDRVELSPKVLAQYKEFEKEQVLELINADEPISAASAAALSNKLQQFANGAIYDADRKVIELHDEKLEKLEELVEAANGSPVLVAYSYKHDLDRIMKKLKAYKPVKLEKPEQIAEWNAGKIKVLVTHPASAGHGLNLQKGGHTLIWFGNTWSLELYMQFNARLYRQGQAYPVTVHHILTTGTVDEKIIKALDGKKQTQDGLMQSIKELMEFYSKK